MSAKAKRKKMTMAEQADIHELYEESVQNVDHEVEFVQQTFENLRGRKAYLLREDFCGTASAACEWAKQGEAFQSIGVDLDPSVLEWGRENRVGRLPVADQARVRLIESDVMNVETPPVDILVAFNFSYWIFDSRALMLSYFKQAFHSLKDDGLFFCDMFGGSEAFEETEEETEHDEFTYIWHQEEFHPVTHYMRTISISSSRMGRKSKRRSPTNGVYGRRRKSGNCCWKPVSRTQPSTGKARTRMERVMVNFRRKTTVMPIWPGSPTSLLKSESITVFISVSYKDNL